MNHSRDCASVLNDSIVTEVELPVTDYVGHQEVSAVRLTLHQNITILLQRDAIVGHAEAIRTQSRKTSR